MARSDKEMPQQALVLAPAAVLERRRQSPCVFDDTVVEERHPHFEAVRHARPIHLGENAVGKQGEEIEVAHSLHGVGNDFGMLGRLPAHPTFRRPSHMADGANTAFRVSRYSALKSPVSRTAAAIAPPG